MPFWRPFGYSLSVVQDDAGVNVEPTNPEGKAMQHRQAAAAAAAAVTVP